MVESLANAGLTFLIGMNAEEIQKAVLAKWMPELDLIISGEERPRMGTFDPNRATLYCPSYSEESNKLDCWMVFTMPINRLLGQSRYDRLAEAKLRLEVAVDPAWLWSIDLADMSLAAGNISRHVALHGDGDEYRGSHHSTGEVVIPRDYVSQVMAQRRNTNLRAH